eukprot:366399-Chlamydomonas_euryale.AAC.30
MACMLSGTNQASAMQVRGRLTPVNRALPPLYLPLTWNPAVAGYVSNPSASVAAAPGRPALVHAQPGAGRH